MFAHREVRGGIGTAVTDRFGGVSTAPYDALDLADHVGDDAAAVAANRERLREATLESGRLVTMRQVHGAEVAVVSDDRQVPEADGLVTTTPGLVLVVQVADCFPVLLWDAQARVVAAVHAGRRGVAAGVVPRALGVMAREGAAVDRVEALVGPGICADHYEVPADLRDAVDAAVPGTGAATGDGRPALDLAAGIVAQLRDAGVAGWDVLPECTYETPHLYSYRRDGTTGRFAGLVWIQP